MRVRQQGRVNSKICGEISWESINGKQNPSNDIRKEGSTWTNIDPPHQGAGTRSCPVGYQESRGKGQYKNNGRVIMIIRTVTRKEDEKFQLYGHTMIRRMIPQQGKFNKRINNKKRDKQKSAITEATKRHKGKERRNPQVDWNKMRTQQRRNHRPQRVVCMKEMKGKATITWLEKEINEKCKGKTWDGLA